MQTSISNSKMALKKTEKAIEDIKKSLESGKLVLGRNASFKRLKQGSLAKIFISSNCPADTRSDITYYAKLAKIKIVEVDHPNEELGTLCKKPFSISVIGLLK